MVYPVIAAKTGIAVYQVGVGFPVRLEAKAPAVIVGFPVSVGPLDNQVLAGFQVKLEPVD
jgi:hypothetical protein